MERYNLPRHVTTFVGRVAEIADCVSLLNDPACHLLTLTGPGGVGKTRLAVEVGVRMTDIFADGVYFVPLQPLNSVDNVVSTIVTALPLQQRGEANLKQQLLDYLHDKQMLLLLDNMEHLLEFSPVIVEFILSAPQVKLLVTSREPLKLQEEWVRQVAGLAFPVNPANDGDESYSAIQLFTERVARRTEAFDLENEYRHVVQLCQLVDGAPLALELAASWITVMSCAAIVDEIKRDITILSTTVQNVEARHRSMRAVFDHSWWLLTDKEQMVMRRLAVFRGGFTREAAAEVAGATLPVLASLVDKSMVKSDSGERYDLHELLRQYTQERLIASGEHEPLSDAHESYFADFVHQRTEDLKGHGQFKAITEINTDFENVRTAWMHATDHLHQQTIMQMIEGLWVLCEFRNHTQEALALFRYAEGQFLPQHHDGSKQLWGRLAARNLVSQASEKQFDMALKIAQSSEDAKEIAFCLLQLGRAAYRNGDVDQSDALLKQGLLIYQELGDRFGESLANKELMYRSSHERPWEHIRHHGFEALRLKREIGDRYGSMYPLSVTGLDAVRQGKFAEAESRWLELVTIGEEIDNLYLMSYGYAHQAHKILFFQGEFRRARVVAEKALQLATKIDAPDAIGFALTTLSMLECMKENYLEGKRLAMKAVAEARRGLHEVELVATVGLTMAQCGLEDYQSAKESLVQASTFLTEIMNLVGKASGLSLAAIILANEGNLVRAAELLGLAFTHPVGVSCWMEQWELLSRLQMHLEEVLGTEEYLAAWERGCRLDLEQTGAQVFKELRSELHRPVTEAKQPLIEPISNRELEVLLLIGAGLTNHEIAEQLFISVSTVKKHINHIYGKLGVKNRTSAVARARELQILQ